MPASPEPQPFAFDLARALARLGYQAADERIRHEVRQIARLLRDSITDRPDEVIALLDDLLTQFWAIEQHPPTGIPEYLR